MAMVLGSAAVARADVTKDRVEVKRLQEEAKRLRHDGRWYAALEKLQLAYETTPTPATAVQLARELERFDRLLEAHTLLASVATMPVEKGEATRVTRSRGEAKGLAKAIDARIPRLKIVAPMAADSSAVFTIDGKPIATEQRNELIRVDPGAHVVELTVNGASSKVLVTVTPGEYRDVEVPPPVPIIVEPSKPAKPVEPVVRPPGAKPPATGPLQMKDSKSSLEYGRTWPVITAGFGIGGMALLWGATSGIASLVLQSDIEAECPTGDCSETASKQTQQEVSSTMALIGLGVGAVGVGMGTVALIIHVTKGDEPKDKGKERKAAAPELRARFTGTGAAIELAF